MNDENVAPPMGLADFTAVRRLNKPLMERRRRQRINNCLDELKAILETLSKNESSYLSKLEKADILELTVQCIRNLKRRQADSATPIARSDAESYALGYDACVAEVMQCLRSRQTDNGVDSSVQPSVVTGLLDHLAKRRCGMLVGSDDGHRDTDNSSRDVGGAPTHRLQVLPVASRILNNEHSLPPMTSINRDVSSRNNSSAVVEACSTSSPFDAVDLSDVDMTSSTPWSLLASDFARRPLANRMSHLTSSTSHHSRSATLSNVQAGLRVRSRCSDLSTSDVAIVYDSDRLRRRVIRPSGTPMNPVSAADDRSILRATLSPAGGLPSASVTSSPVSSPSSFVVALSPVWNGGDISQDKTMVASSSYALSPVGLLSDESGNGPRKTVDGDMPTSSLMWRPW